MRIHASHEPRFDRHSFFHRRRPQPTTTIRRNHPDSATTHETTESIHQIRRDLIRSRNHHANIETGALARRRLTSRLSRALLQNHRNQHGISSETKPHLRSGNNLSHKRHQPSPINKPGKSR
ncbi:Uncharacterized protein Rs2_17298 [Raphanus sativus]|nr:Uncharacterized protein Rs2_17298 [Raphanus sativus]